MFTKLECVIVFTLLFSLFSAKLVKVQEFTASWYSIESLRAEGTYKTSKGIMANGKEINENAYTCASRDYAIGDWLLVTAIDSGRNVIVQVTDRIGRRFKGKRIDLSKGAFGKLLMEGETFDKGLLKVKVTKL